MKGTEVEAREWWCPVMRTREIPLPPNTGVSYYGSSPGHVPDICNCLASKCAMWRWAYNDDGTQNDQSQSDTIGYCGLGGRP